MQKKEIFVLVGKTMSGKSTLVQNIKEDINANFIISFTSRPKREGEKHGVDYYFISRALAEKYISINQVIASRIYFPHHSFGINPWYYGLFLGDFTTGLDKKLLITDPQGLKEIKQRFDNVVTIYLNITEEEQAKRLSSRGSSLNAEQIRRIEDDDKEFKKGLKFWDFELDASKSKEELQKELIEIVNK